MKIVKALVLTGYGLNCDNETAHAFELAGAAPVKVHINSLIDGSATISDYRILAFVGGFSWGDDHGAGVVQAVRLKTSIGDQIREFIEKGRLILGICNGFQALVNLGLLPGLGHDYRSRLVALTYNDCGNFRDDWVTLSVNADSPCIFTRGIERIDLPVRHGEGKFHAETPVIERLTAGKQVVMRYAAPDGQPAGRQFPYNPNGSVDDIAGICDPTGRVFGLMPHPEAYNHFTNHPLWSRRKESSRRKKEKVEPEPTPGIKIFRNAVEFVKGGLNASV
ncbi:MAG: phosphoribosylformylglycinamidine synthase subunit PurQ [Desulfobacterales bacterium]|jgi:phosphoribosylformylglycinamidine synthase